MEIGDSLNHAALSLWANHFTTCGYSLWIVARDATLAPPFRNPMDRGLVRCTSTVNACEIHFSQSQFRNHGNATITFVTDIVPSMNKANNHVLATLSQRTCFGGWLGGVSLPQNLGGTTRHFAPPPPPHGASNSKLPSLENGKYVQ